MRPLNLITVFITFLSSLSLFAKGIEIRGRVTDIDHKPIPAVTVSILGTTQGTFTDEEGKYTLETAAADTVTVSFTCLGYEPRQRSIVHAFSEQGYIINATLKKSNISLSEVEITEYKAQTDGMQSLDASIARKTRDASGGNIESLLATLPGVVSSSELSTGYNVRGGTFDENAVYINGMEVYRPQSIASGQQEGMSVINPAMTENIKFSTGGFSAEYDDKISSILDITYRRPQKFQASLTASLMGLSALLGQSTERFSQLHGFRFRKNSSILSTLDEQGEYDPKFLDYQLHLQGKLNSKWNIGFFGNIAINNYKFTPISRITTFGTIDDAKQFRIYFDGKEYDRFESWQGRANLNYVWKKNADITLNLGGTLLNELLTQDISGEYWLDESGSAESSENLESELGIGKTLQHQRNRLKTRIFEANIKGHIAFNNNHITYGLGANHRKISENTREWEMHDSAGYSFMHRSLVSNQSVNMLRFYAFIQDSWRMKISEDGLLGINVGLRLSHTNFNRETILSPRFLLSYIPGSGRGWVFRLSGGVYYQSPFYKEFRQTSTTDGTYYYTSLNKELKSPRSLQFVLGADKTFRAFERLFKLTGEIYYKNIKNLVPYEIDNLKIVYSGKNSGTGNIMGLDLRLFGEFVSGSDSWISIGLMNATQRVDGVKSPMPTDRRYNLALYFTDYFPKIPRLKFFLRGILNDGLPVFSPNTYGEKGYFRMSSYKRIDIGLSYALVKEREDEYYKNRFIKSAWLGFDIFNLLDISNVAGYYWISDVNGINYAVPNYLTKRQFNLTLSIEF